MKKAFLFIFTIGVLFSCTETKPVADPKVLMDADIAFSDYSVKHGIQKRHSSNLPTIVWFC